MANGLVLCLNVNKKRDRQDDYKIKTMCCGGGNVDTRCWLCPNHCTNSK